ncbi:MAG: hypothetical protein AMJ93_16315 [Anaerolineae bacterium SM23_84]|nr:MAG: hypothetical protein AMJ93_16315 [Anaerolineae bacterium SM23_84]
MSSSSFWVDSLFLTSDEVTSDELEANEDAIVTKIDGVSGYKGIDLSVVLCYTNHAPRPTPRKKDTGPFCINYVGLRIDRPGKRRQYEMGKKAWAVNMEVRQSLPAVKVRRALSSNRMKE